MPELDGVALHARYLAAAEAIEIGGDWYDAFALPDDRLYVSVGDVAGHGVDAVEVMGQLRNAARARYLDRLDPAEILRRLSALADVGTARAFATAVIARLDLSRESLRVAVAAHPPPLCVRAGGVVEVLSLPPGPPLGAVADPSFRAIDVHVAPGDTLVFYSDGLIERRSEPIDVGIERLQHALEGTATIDLDALVERALTSLPPAQHRFDDACLLTIRLQPA